MKISTLVFLLLFLAVVAIAIWGYFTSAFPAPLPAWHRATPETATSQPNATRGLEAQASHSFTYGTALYTINKIDRVSELKRGTGSLITSGDFLLVFLSVKNKGREPITLGPSDFALCDSEGRKFTLHQEATKLAGLAYEKEDLFNEALQPGIDKEGVLVFNVPKETAGLSLRLFNGYLDVNLGL